MSDKFTPEPWLARLVPNDLPENNHWQVVANSPHVRGKNQIICELNGPWATGNYEANAKLIAAAPELLGALRDLFEHCVMVHAHWGEGCNLKEATAAVEAAKSAMEKATK